MPWHILGSELLWNRPAGLPLASFYPDTELAVASSAPHADAAFTLDSHYRTCVLYRVSQTLGKGRKTLGNFFAECSTRRSAHDLSSTGEAGFAECLFSGTRQTFAVCQAALGKKS